MADARHLDTDSDGHAALSICESMLIALSDLKILKLGDARDILTDAAAAHRGAGGTADQLARHETVAAIIDRVRTSTNSVPK